jgi:hypothetical protein
LLLPVVAAVVARVPAPEAALAVAVQAVSVLEPLCLLPLEPSTPLRLALVVLVVPTELHREAQAKILYLAPSHRLAVVLEPNLLITAAPAPLREVTAVPVVAVLVLPLAVLETRQTYLHHKAITVAGLFIRPLHTAQAVAVEPTQRDQPELHRLVETAALEQHPAFPAHR